MRHPLLLLSTVLALGLSACSGEAEIDVDTSPDVTATETVSDEVTETETVLTPTPVPTTTDGTEDEAGATTSPAEEEDVSELAFAECRTDRYTIGYPADWNVNEPDEYTSECTIFHPDEIETPDQPQDRGLHWAVTVYIDAVEYERATEGDGPNEELSSSELIVDGRDAHVREYRSTGDALIPEGERSYRYVVDLDGEILVVSTTTIGDTDYERDKAIIDRMVREELEISG